MNEKIRKQLQNEFFKNIEALNKLDEETLKMAAAMSALYCMTLNGSPEGYHKFQEMLMKNIDEDKLNNLVYNQK